jgi:hypothetical protein
MKNLNLPEEDVEPLTSICILSFNSLLFRLSEKVSNIPACTVSICRDESIDMDFKDLLINVDKDGEVRFYGNCNGSEIRRTKYYDPKNPASDFERLVDWIKINLVDSEL